MAWKVSGELSTGDTKDKSETIALKPGKYSYTLKASGGGHVRFKAEAYTPPMVGERGTSGSWGTIEERSRVASGATLRGNFNVPTVHLSSQVTAKATEVRFIFSRGILTKTSSYELSFEAA